KTDRRQRCRAIVNRLRSRHCFRCCLARSPVAVLIVLIPYPLGPIYRQRSGRETIYLRLWPGRRFLDRHYDLSKPIREIGYVKINWRSIGHQRRRSPPSCHEFAGNDRVVLMARCEPEPACAQSISIRLARKFPWPNLFPYRSRVVLLLGSYSPSLFPYRSLATCFPLLSVTMAPRRLPYRSRRISSDINCSFPLLRALCGARFLQPRYWHKFESKRHCCTATFLE